jgi:hypothetical protein
VANRERGWLFGSRPGPHLQHQEQRNGRSALRVVEKMLNHTFDGVMAVYNHAAYDAERRQALEDSSAYLMEMAAPSAAVVPLRSRVTRTA